MTEDNQSVEIAVLGPLLVRVGGVQQPLPAPKQRTLLSRLVISAGRSVSSDQLVDALWGDRPPATAAKNLHVLIGRLRKLLGPQVLVTDPFGYRLDPQACIVDAHSFERLVDEAEQQDAETAGRTISIRLLTQALALWRGDVAVELDAHWGVPHASRWAEMRHVAHERLLSLKVATCPSPELVDEIRALGAHHPERESAHVLLVDVLRQIGDLPAARIALEDALIALERDLGLAPGQDLAVLAAEFGIRAEEVQAAPDPASYALRAAIDSFGRRFRVADVLSAVAEDVSAADVLDALEEMIDRGELLRTVEKDGRACLTRTDATVSGEVSS